MALWSEWSDGKKWVMGIFSAVIIAATTATITRISAPTVAPSGDPQPKVNAVPASNSAVSPASGLPPSQEGSAPKPFPSEKEMFGAWNFEYFVANSPEYKRRMILADKNVLGIDNPAYNGFDIGQPFSPRGTWNYDPTEGIVNVAFTTKVSPDTGRFTVGDPLYNSISCRLQLDQTHTILQGRCVTGKNPTALRLSR